MGRAVDLGVRVLPGIGPADMDQMLATATGQFRFVVVDVLGAILPDKRDDKMPYFGC